MFLNFKITNYRSIGKEIIVDFGISASQKSSAFTEAKGITINNIACIVGPNASGKSNILKAIVLFIRYVYKSYSTPQFRDANLFASHFCCGEAPTKFSTEFIDNERQYKYEISILKGLVQEESLRVRDETTKRYNSVFKRKSNEYIQNSIQINAQDIGRLRDDMSLLSLMIELNYFKSDEFLIFKRLLTNVKPEFIIGNWDPVQRLNEITQVLEKDNLLLEELIDELKNIDTGISGLTLAKLRQTGVDGMSSNKEVSTIVATHEIDNKIHPLIVFEESGGTLHYIELFVRLYQILQGGGLLIADELEQSLHPDITSRIINRFLNKDKNPNNAQLLFTTHNPWFLQDLSKTQIFISEKDENAETELTRLDEIPGVRNDENYFMKYISGEYDGRPKIKEF